MKIVQGLPPLFDVIDAAFHVAGKSVIFAWADTIYNPQGITITPALYAHECVHGERQGADVVGWWQRYIEDPQFRLVEELLAHKVEYETLCASSDSRNERRFYLRQVAGKLSSPLYGRLISYEAARKELRFRAA